MIVVLRALKLGDLLVAVPALRGLRRHWPDQHIVLACPGWLTPLALLSGAVDEVSHQHGMTPLPDRLHGAEVVVNLHGTGPRSTAVLDALAPRRRIGFAGHGWPGPAWVDDEHERERWCRLLAHAGIPADPTDLLFDRPTTPSPAPGAVVVHPGAAYGSKRWPPERFARVVNALVRAGREVVITGSAAEAPLAREVADRSGTRPRVLAGCTDLLELAALIASATLVISGDTGTAHLAYAFRTPAVVLFGPAHPRHWGPPPGPHTVLTATHLRHGDPFANTSDPALLAVTPDDVLAAATELLASRSTASLS
ncbi:glycosyltransferase family 9 protein [Actinophytocola sp.]|uniref:glycosyltransferase family 9 protein n=1 Tax=Actinophytocola sp. TaxID=1872138 RepID=UPI00389A11B1